MADVLSANANGVVVVFENECKNQVFTYQLNGRKPTFLGWGDVHDKQYNKMVSSFKLVNLLSSNSNGLLYTGLLADNEFCPYTLTAYASDTYFERMREQTDSVPGT